MTYKKLKYNYEYTRFPTKQVYLSKQKKNIEIDVWKTRLTYQVGAIKLPPERLIQIQSRSKFVASLLRMCETGTTFILCMEVLIANPINIIINPLKQWSKPRDIVLVSILQIRHGNYQTEQISLVTNDGKISIEIMIGKIKQNYYQQ